MEQPHKSSPKSSTLCWKSRKTLALHSVDLLPAWNREALHSQAKKLCKEGGISLMPHQVDASPYPLWFCSTMNYVFSKGLPVRAAVGIWGRICCSAMQFLLFSVKSLTQFPHLAKCSVQALKFPAYVCVHSKLSNKTYMINLLLANVINGFFHHQRQVSLLIQYWLSYIQCLKAHVFSMFSDAFLSWRQQQLKFQVKLGTRLFQCKWIFVTLLLYQQLLMCVKPNLVFPTSSSIMLLETSYR